MIDIIFSISILMILYKYFYYKLFILWEWLSKHLKHWERWSTLRSGRCWTFSTSNYHSLSPKSEAKTVIRKTLFSW